MQLEPTVFSTPDRRRRLRGVVGACWLLVIVVVCIGLLYVMGSLAFVNTIASIGILIVAAMGLTIIFAVMRVANFAHGEFIMLGAYVAWGVTPLLGYFVALGVAFILLAGVGLIVEFAVLRHLRHGGLIPPMLATWALGIILRQGVAAAFGSGLKPVTAPIQGSISFQGVPYPGFSMFVISTCVLVVLVVLALYARTAFGAKSRAAAEDSVMAEAVGINVPRINYASMALGAGMAGLAGVLLSPLQAVDPFMGSPWVVKSFLTIIVGGIGNVSGTLVGANALGWPEQLISHLVSSNNFPSLFLAQIVVYILAAVLIVIRPRGLLGGARSRTD